jgi:ABC-2 type transport system permease protein
MFSILKTEWLKIKNYPAFWWILGIIIFSFPGINYLFYFIHKDMTRSKDMAAQVANAIFGSPFSFPEVFKTVAFTSSIFMLIPAILVIMLICNEYTYKTNRQNIIDGWSRNNFLLGKFFSVFIIATITALLAFTVSFVIGLINKNEAAVAQPYNQIKYMFYFYLQALSQLSFAFLLGLLLRRAFITLGVYIFYSIILENILEGLGKKYVQDAGRFLFLEISNRLTPLPTFMSKFGEERYNTLMGQFNQHIALTILYTAIFWLLSFWIIKKRDL